jgi:hypothetical protein
VGWCRDFIILGAALGEHPKRLPLGASLPPLFTLHHDYGNCAFALQYKPDVSMGPASIDKPALTAVLSSDGVHGWV